MGWDPVTSGLVEPDEAYKGKRVQKIHVAKNGDLFLETHGFRPGIITGVLLDSSSSTNRGGTGKAFDWERVQPWAGVINTAVTSLVPVGSMLIANAMNTNGLALNRFRSEVLAHTGVLAAAVFVVVAVESLKKHRIYKRTYKQTKRFQAHDEENACQVGDIVRIEETRPLSKMKRWRLVEIMKLGSGIVPVAEVLAEADPDLTFKTSDEAEE